MKKILAIVLSAAALLLTLAGCGPKTASAGNASGGNAVYLGTFENIRAWLDEHGVPGDLVVAVGSGDVYRQTKKLL